MLNGESSPTCKTIPGDPQGSVPNLGRYNFLVYINDLVEETKLDGNNITLYADAVTCCCSELYNLLKISIMFKKALST